MQVRVCDCCGRPAHACEERSHVAPNPLKVPGDIKVKVRVQFELWNEGCDRAVQNQKPDLCDDCWLDMLEQMLKRFDNREKPETAEHELAGWCSAKGVWERSASPVVNITNELEVTREALRLANELLTVKGCTTFNIQRGLINKVG